MDSINFLIDLERGRQAEVLVANAFRTMGFAVMDVTKSPKF